MNNATMLQNTRKWDRRQGLGCARVYFYDVDSGKELAAFVWMGNAEAGVWRGKRYMDTTLAFFVVDAATMTHGEITAASFPGLRVAAKVWHGGSAKPEWSALVDTARGWLGNKASCEMAARGETVGRTEIGINATMWSKVAA